MRIVPPPRFRPVAYAGALLLFLAAVTRLALALRPDVSVGGPGDWLQVFARGLVFDLAAAAYVLFLPIVWLALVPNAVARWRAHRALVVLAFWVFAFGFLVLPVSEWLFWDEFAARFNFIAVDYLIYTQEVLGNIWESYPVGWMLVGLAGLAALVTVPFAKRLWQAGSEPLGWRARGAALAAAGLALGFAIGLVDEGAKTFSSNDAANELAGDGLYDFFAANRRNDLDFERYYATVAPATALSTVRAGFPLAHWVQPERGGTERLVGPLSGERRLNVVLVSVESLGAEYVGAYGDPRGLTPNLDRLSKESLWFSRVYATGNRTVRGMEALSLALPPTPGESIVRRPGNGLLFSLGSVLEDRDYAVLFAYGGYGYFDNMNAFFDSNDYRVVDRNSIPSDKVEFENVWGVADEHLFDQVIREIDAEKAAHPDRPVFVHVMTTSNHRPYTYPPGRIDIPTPGGRLGGVKYSDYAIGRFLEQARARPWFRDTLFVLTADHGANARGTLRIPVDKYLIPVMVYSPAHVAPRRVDRLMSQIDIAPTLLGLLRLRYYSKFFGRDVLDSPPETDRAFVANYETLGYLKGDRLLVLHPKRKVEEFVVGQEGAELTRVARPDAGLQAEAVSYYQLAADLYKHGGYLDEEQVPPGPGRVARITTIRRKEGAN
ncbi:MAG TPA: sulfatase-like hydrolase/transferase [Burkholderiales bacterium]|nr:sulfatase-like hydrolase/transferase [Burkholderiales bacterium]